ncbi:hypothetical protein [Peptostreptococcus faecalis]|uniref:hypothetical protein n=1 Tax=Peptostreptococcus faecalis TaxID=2045015 RepID=UPI000C7D8A34|nr:hypothetical protein [Peptostreptococcus faecalis]
MPNIIEYTKLYEKKLDEHILQAMVTGWMDSNAGQVQYNGGNEVKVPIMTIDGLANYDRSQSGGYVGGDVNLRYQTLTMTQDRGRSFTIDVRDVDETGGVLMIGKMMKEFQGTQVAPEIDAYRLSKLAQVAMKHKDNNESGYTPKSDDVIRKVKEGIKKIRKTGYSGQLVIHMNYDTLNEFEMVKPTVANTVTFTVNGVETRVNQIDGCPIIPTTDNKMITEITLNDGKTAGQEAGGFAPTDSAVPINFLIVAQTTPLAITKIDTMRIFDPNTNQKANAWLGDYRRHHDLWVLENKEKTIYVNTGVKATEPAKAK